MILSASRRTDIPAFYADWFLNRLRQGYVLIPNPYRSKQLTRLSFRPETIDCIVFWTKNAGPLLGRLDEMESLGYKNYYFEYTLTPYGPAIEKHVGTKAEAVRLFQQTSDRVGPRRVDWRFDPILLGGEVTEAYILDRFDALARRLAPYTERCIISFIDIYRHLRPAFEAVPDEKADFIARHLAQIASGYRLKVYACGEKRDYSRYGILPSACIDREKIESLAGYRLQTGKDAGQRAACGCLESVDVGAYNTCRHGCTYCYASRCRLVAGSGPAAFPGPLAPMLTGHPAGDEKITEKTAVSFRDRQNPLFAG